MKTCIRVDKWTTTLPPSEITLSCISVTPFERWKVNRGKSPQVYFMVISEAKIFWRGFQLKHRNPRKASITHYLMKYFRLQFLTFPAFIINFWQISLSSLNSCSFLSSFIIFSRILVFHYLTNTLTHTHKTHKIKSYVAFSGKTEVFQSWTLSLLHSS